MTKYDETQNQEQNYQSYKFPSEGDEQTDFNDEAIETHPGSDPQNNNYQTNEEFSFNAAGSGSSGSEEDEGSRRGSGSRSDLSEEARKMRTSDDPEERSEAARKMGQKGGEHSHGGHGSSSNKK